MQQQILGVRGKAGSKLARENIDKVSYEKLADYINQGLQVMVFVHSRKDTVNTARTFIRMAVEYGELEIFNCSEADSYEKYKREASIKIEVKIERIVCSWVWCPSCWYVA